MRRSSFAKALWIGARRGRSLLWRRLSRWRSTAFRRSVQIRHAQGGDSDKGTIKLEIEMAA